MIANFGRTLPVILATVGLCSASSTVMAQGNTFNPYGNSGYADYREFGNAMISNNPALPGQAVLNNSPTIGRPRANSFQQYTNELDGADSEASYRRGSSNLPYFQAYQRLNGQNNRVYQPNNTEADRRFYERQKKRDQDYAKALEERDPAKRSKLLRQVESNSLDRPANTNRPGATKPTIAPNRISSPPVAPRSTSPVERRLPAPPPFPESPNRRPPSTRAPGTARTAPSIAPRSRPFPSNLPAPEPSNIPIPPPR